MSKITPDHLSRSAYVYVRQSTPGQLTNNPEVGVVNMASQPAHGLLGGKM